MMRKTAVEADAGLRHLWGLILSGVHTGKEYLRRRGPVKFRDRFSFRMYNPSKPAQFGIKVYKLSAGDGVGAGCTSVFRIYIGKEKGDMQSFQKAVVDLMEAGVFLTRCILSSWTTGQTGATCLDS